MKVCESFESIQGEGALMGRPMLFIRLGGCNLACEWCDTKYAWDTYDEQSVDDVAARITGSDKRLVCWTGGEPLLQKEAVCDVIGQTPDRLHCLETNGTIAVPPAVFHHVTVSPKSLSVPPVAADTYKFVVAGDIEQGVSNILDYAARHDIPREKVYAQPECTSPSEALARGAQLWHVCVREGISFSPRLHTLLFGAKRGI